MSKMSSEGDELTDEDDSLFTSEEILRKMGFTSSLISRATEVPECTDTQIIGPSLGVSRGEDKGNNVSCSLTVPKEDGFQLQIMQSKTRKSIKEPKCADTLISSGVPDFPNGNGKENLPCSFIDLEVDDCQPDMQQVQINFNDSYSDLHSFNSSIFSDVNVSSSITGEVSDNGIENPNGTPDNGRVYLQENRTEKRKRTFNQHRPKKITKILEDVDFSSYDELDPDDPDYIPIGGLSDDEELQKSASNSPTQISPENTNFLRNEENIPEPVRPQENEEDNNVEELARPAKLRNKNNKQNWSKVVNYDKRQKGEAYVGYRRSGPGKIAHDVPREAKVMGPRCASTACMRYKLRSCPVITEENRQTIFNSFWKTMTWDQRKTYIVSLMESVDISRKKTKSEISRRSETLKYHLVVQNKRLQVCQLTFLNTLGIKKWTVRYWLNGEGKALSSNVNVSDNKIVPSSSITRESKKGQPRKIEDVDFLKNFFKSLPQLPSHYCRSSSTKLYIEPTFESMKDIYDLYGDECKSNGKNVLSRFTFDKIFHKENLSLFQPKKDLCDTCHSFKVKSGNVTQEQYKEHILQKDRARHEKTMDTEKAKAKEIHVFTQDTQSVKLAPCVNASAMYYKTKLCVHNFTMYNHGTKDAMTYWWDETQSDLSASSFASCVIDNLRNTLNDDLKSLTLWSDGCCYQNRSSIMANALLNLSMEKKVVIEQKYLVKGHTMMECDSVHSAIDTILNPKRGTKNKKTVKEIYLPSQYAQYAREARKKPFPYRSVYLDFSFFSNFSKKETMIYESIRPGKKTGDPKVQDLRALKYNPNGTIEFKINFDDEYALLPIRPNKTVSNVFPRLNNARLRIAKSKWDHLQELKAHIPSDCHEYYNNIPYEN